MVKRLHHQLRLMTDSAKFAPKKTGMSKNPKTRPRAMEGNKSSGTMYLS